MGDAPPVTVPTAVREPFDFGDEPFGDHGAVVAQFKNDTTTHSAGGELTAVVWVDARGFTRHEFGDALLAVGGGDDNAVQIFSVCLLYTSPSPRDRG